MSAAEPEDDFAEDPDEQDDEGEEAVTAGGRCPICEMLAGECDHLVASIDRTYAEFVAGAIFAHERVILDLLERLVSPGAQCGCCQTGRGSAGLLFYALSFGETVTN